MNKKFVYGLLGLSVLANVVMVNRVLKTYHIVDNCEDMLLWLVTNASEENVDKVFTSMMEKLEDGE